MASDWVEGPASVFQLPSSRRPAPLPEPEQSNLLPQPATPMPDMQPGPQDIEAPLGMPTLGVTNGHRPAAPHGLEGGVSSTTVRPQPREQSGEAINMWNEPPPPAGIPQTAAVSPKLYSGWLSETHPALKATAKDCVIEIKGQWDDSGHALHNFGINFTKITPKELQKTALGNTKVLIVDCAGEIPSAALSIIRDFVANGGYLITTDWSLDNCLARAIPGYVEWNSANSVSELVDASADKNVRSTDDGDLLLNVVPRAYWKLDDKCQMVKVRRPDAVTVLVRSKRLAYQDPNRTFALTPKTGTSINDIGVLALTFRYEKGRVLHLVGHFDNNTDLAFKNSLPDPAPRIGISMRQAIAANFIAAALKNAPAASEKPN